MGDLDALARAIPALHDDAYNPTRTIGLRPVEPNTFNAPYLIANRHVSTHPHLRHATGGTPSNGPGQGDQTARTMWTTTCRTITSAYQAIVPTSRQQRHRHPATPADLTGMLAMIAKTTPTDPPAIVAHHLLQLERLTTVLAGWHSTWTPEPNHPICANPKRRHRCQGHPVIADDLCRSCYNHDRYQARKATG